MNLKVDEHSIVPKCDRRNMPRLESDYQIRRYVFEDCTHCGSEGRQIIPKAIRGAEKYRKCTHCEGHGYKKTKYFLIEKV